MMAADTHVNGNIIQCFQQWGWLDGLRARSAGTVFVTDADIAKSLDAEMGEQGCKIVEIGAHTDMPVEGVKEVIFFCRQFERIQARKMAARYPDVIVSSATYDYLPLGVLSGRFERGQFKPALQSRNFNLIISGPLAGAEDLIELLKVNKVCAPQKFMTHALAYWVREQADFQPLRYLRGVRGCFSETTVDLFLETDVLIEVVKKTNVPWEKLFVPASGLNFRVLYFTRRAKIAQAIELTQKRGAPSALLLGGQSSALNVKAADEAVVIDAWVEALLRLEITIEKAMTSVATLKNVTYEDLLGAPDNVLPDVGDFFKRGVRKKRDYKPIVQAIDSHAALDAQIKQHNERLIHSLGLHVSAEGSFTSLTNQLLDA
ncbi:hypothetical protein [Kordiimonas aquimaris]|uniref:hypothetical protein n=1 Tax=Kordiimonas aquimaris TaxID=707591 RepID=UPI0021CF0F22|nr:hypothetical protein [Kordiimonas aquimaris]